MAPLMFLKIYSVNNAINKIEIVHFVVHTVYTQFQRNCDFATNIGF